MLPENRVVTLALFKIFLYVDELYYSKFPLCCKFLPQTTVNFLTHCTSRYDSIEMKLKLGVVYSVSCVWPAVPTVGDNQRETGVKILMRSNCLP